MKQNLLAGCNDQQVPINDFKQTFCVRCRNNTCVNAGWAKSTFEERISTQVERLLVNPQRARPEDTRFDPLRAMHFMEIPAAIAIARGKDPWLGPVVHLADPPLVTATSQVVEDAVSKLAEVRGQRPRAPTDISINVEDTPIHQPLVEDQPKVSAPPVMKPPAINTDFPEDGVVLGGSSSQMGSTSVKPEVDPWAPKAKMNIVPRGAKIKMGGQ